MALVMPSFFQSFFVIAVVILVFNFVIFFHELGHFLAALWRGLKVERFQIWFGKPLWKKNWRGVQYGIGWLPFGGFVSLPQMADMQSIEGKNLTKEPLAKVSALDKIIVAFAGPLFSVLLAVIAAVLVSWVGKPNTHFATTRVGYVKEGSPAEKAGFLPGDVIQSLNGKSIGYFAGDMEKGLVENIATSQGEHLVFKVKRGDTYMQLVSSYEIPQTPWYQRSGMRQIGVAPYQKVIVGKVLANSPAKRAGLEVGDRIIAVDDVPLLSTLSLGDAAQRDGVRQLTILRHGKEKTCSIQSLYPLEPHAKKKAFGISFLPDEAAIETSLSYPSVVEQLFESAKLMQKTFYLLVSRVSSVGVDQLSGPVGIGKAYYSMLVSSSDGWKLALAFTVLLNVNLAILNLLPFPVLDGGHILLGFLEWIVKKPVRIALLEWIQGVAVLILFALFLYITSKDVGGFFEKTDSVHAPLRFAPPSEQ